jgi:hypothetical protein
MNLSGNYSQYQGMQQYLSQLAGHIASIGGDPTAIPPIVTGIWLVDKIEKLV